MTQISAVVATIVIVVMTTKAIVNSLIADILVMMIVHLLKKMMIMKFVNQMMKYKEHNNRTMKNQIKVNCRITFKINNKYKVTHKMMYKIQ